MPLRVCTVLSRVPQGVYCSLPCTSECCYACSGNVNPGVVIPVPAMLTRVLFPLCTSGCYSRCVPQVVTVLHTVGGPRSAHC